MMGNDKDVNKEYLFLATIGQGSFGKVHKVQSRTDSKIYACKEIDYQKMQEKERKLLVHEVNTLKEMHHQNIVSYVDRFLDKGKSKIFIVMEYCENGDLARYIKRHKQERKYIAEEKIWSVLVQLLQAYRYCHYDMLAQNNHKIIHRDMKPGNVFLSKDGSIKLGDFGLCRSLNDDSIAATNVGTPLYMPPEILAKQQYTEKADIWSLGCVVYELAALQPPFAANNMDSLKIKVRQGARPPLPSMYSQTLRQIIDLMLENKQDKRSSVQDLLQFPKIIEMQQKMISLGMPGVDIPTNQANAVPIVQPVLVPPSAQFNLQAMEAEKKMTPKNQLEQKMNELQTNFGKRDKESDLKAWEERLKAKEAELNQREAELNRQGTQKRF